MSWWQAGPDFLRQFWRGETTPSDINMNKLLVITVLVALLALSAESFRVARQAEDELVAGPGPAGPGPVTQLTDGIKQYYGQAVDTVNSYIESIQGLNIEQKAKNLYDETVKATTTYYGIVYDQVYHAVYGSQ